MEIGAAISGSFAGSGEYDNANDDVAGFDRFGNRSRWVLGLRQLGRAGGRCRRSREFEYANGDGYGGGPYGDHDRDGSGKRACRGVFERRGLRSWASLHCRDVRFSGARWRCR